MTDQARALFETAKATLGHLAIGLKDMQWEEVPTAIVKYLKAHPKTSALQLVCLLVIAVPSLVATPTLLTLGFGSSGPIGGWLAATFQSIYGTPIAFSALQSAAMGGWGAAIVNPVIQGASFVAGGAMEMFKWKSKM